MNFAIFEGLILSHKNEKTIMAGITPHSQLRHAYHVNYKMRTVMATLSAACWTCFMEWKEILRTIFFWAIMHTRQQKLKTQGRKRHIQFRKLVEDFEKSKKRIFVEAKYQ